MSHRAHIVVDLSYGDSGKGTIVDALVRKHHAHTVIRFNGGAQAAHRVVTSDGREHIFSQFGSGMFTAGVRTYLSQFMLVQPWALAPEEEHLCECGITDAYSRLFIHEDALVITPFHRAANRLRERSRSDDRHGSCGIGIGETARDALELDESLVVRMRDFRNLVELKEKLTRVQKQKAEHVASEMKQLVDEKTAQADIFELEDSSAVEFWIDQLLRVPSKLHIVDDTFLKTILSEDGDVVFEGAQGVLLDEWRGFHPYTTWSTCTFQNALDLLARANYSGEIHRIGVVRAYATRHGPGPFITEDSALTERLPDRCNVMSEWQRSFRIGWFDTVAIRYAIAVCGGVDSLAVTCFDRLSDEPEWKICTRYELAVDDPDSELFERDPFRPNMILNIKLGPYQDLAYQARLTNALSRMQPYYSVPTATGSASDNSHSFFSRLTFLLQTKISLISAGPTAEDKQFL